LRPKKGKNWQKIFAYQRESAVALGMESVYNVINCRIMSTLPQHTEHFGKAWRFMDIKDARGAA